MNFYKFEPERRTPFAPKFEIVLMEDIVDVNFDNLRDTILAKNTKLYPRMNMRVIGVQVQENKA